MIKNKIIYFFCTAALIAGSLNAQTGKQKRADKYYDAFAYVKAASLYEELAKQKGANDQIIKRLAHSYNHSGNYVKAEECMLNFIQKTRPMQKKRIHMLRC